MSTYTALTELQAVNKMLSVIGASPISSLTGITGIADAAVAQTTLHEVNREVQSKGWMFNTEYDYTLNTDENDKFALPSNTLDCDTYGEDGSKNLIMRGLFLYDKYNHSYTFTDYTTVKVELILFLDWTEMPNYAREYISIRAARKFAQKVFQSEIIESLTADDEFAAFMTFSERDNANADYNILTSQYDTFNTWFRG